MKLADLTVDDLGKLVRLAYPGASWEGRIELVRWGVGIWRWVKFEHHPTEVMVPLDIEVEFLTDPALLRTPEEKRAFSAAWDAKVEAGWERAGLNKNGNPKTPKERG